MINNADKITLERLAEIERLVREFKENLESGTENPDAFMTLNEIEDAWGTLRANTDIIYSYMAQSMISAINESALIRKKKRIPKTWNQTENRQKKRKNPDDNKRKTAVFQVCPAPCG